MDISETTAPAEGGKKIIILCERVARDDIKVRFYDPNGSWESWGDFNAQDVHKQYAITFKSPSYALNEGSEGKTVLVELVKPSDESTSEPMEFTFLPRGQTTQPSTGPSSMHEKSIQEQKAPQQAYHNTVGTIWQVKKEKEEANNAPWGLPPANAYSQGRQYCQQDLPQTSHPYIPNIPNPYATQQGYPHTHMGTNHGQHAMHPYQDSLNEKNQMAGHSANIYAVSQPSPDSDGFAGMKIRSPTSNSQQAGVDGKNHGFIFAFL